MKAIITFLILGLLFGVVGVIGVPSGPVPIQVQVNPSIDITITPCSSTLDFGSPTPGTPNQAVTCQDTNTPAVTVTNHGGSKVDVNVSGAGAFTSSPYTFALANAVWDIVNPFTNLTNMSTIGAIFTPASGLQNNHNQGIYFWLSVPLEQHSGTYTNTFTFTASEH